MASLLIIGGSGFFGKSILDSFKRQLLKPWDINKITIISRNANDFKHNYPELISDDVECIEGDIASLEYLPEADLVIHAAASSDASQYLTQNEKEKKNIIAGTLNYCRLALKFHKNSQIVYCSSGAVYGFQPNNVKFLTEDAVFGDILKLDDVKKSYAYAKRDCELAIQELGKNNINVVIARCFSFVGKYLPRDQHFAIGNFIADGMNAQDIDVKADKLVYRSYMYADDLVDWLLTLVSNAKPTCPIYNVASDREVEIRDLANIISKIFGVGVRSLKLNNNSINDRYIPSITKAKNELGLSNKNDLEDSILMSINR